MGGVPGQHKSGGADPRTISRFQWPGQARRIRCQPARSGLNAVVIAAAKSARSRIFSSAALASGRDQTTDADFAPVGISASGPDGKKTVDRQLSQSAFRYLPS